MPPSQIVGSDSRSHCTLSRHKNSIFIVSACINNLSISGFCAAILNFDFGLSLTLLARLSTISLLIRSVFSKQLCIFCSIQRPQNFCNDENKWTNYSARFLPRNLETTSNNETYGRSIKRVENDGKFHFINQYLMQDKRRALKDVTTFTMNINKETHKTIESPLITSAQLISEIEGQLGVWIGISVITLVEVMELLIDLCGACLQKRRKKKLETNGEDTRHHGVPVWSNCKAASPSPCMLDSNLALVWTLVLFRLDYCNVLLGGLPHKLTTFEWLDDDLICDCGFKTVDCEKRTSIIIYIQ